MPFMRTKIWQAALRCVLSLVLVIGIPPAPARAADGTVAGLPVPGTMVTSSAEFYPAVLKGLTFDPARPFHFDFHIDTGDSGLRGEALQTEADKLIRYFMAALTVPEKQLWVNLSPYEKNRIIPPVFGETAMGRDLLAQDYLLKQLTASMIYPESELGRRFWSRVYEQARARFGTVDIPVDTYNKIWIVPETAELFVSGRQVFVTESRLKVLLEEDYVALRHNAGHTQHGVGDAPADQLSPTAGLSAQIVREIVVPETEREVNSGKNFAGLRQIFHSLILAAWYKQNLTRSAFAQSYVDRGKTGGIDLDDPAVNQRIYEQYLTAYKKGVYNYIREDYDAATASTIPRKYFSGGVEADVTPVLSVSRSAEKLARSVHGELVTAAAFARATHTLAHEQGGFEAVLEDIAAQLGLTATAGVYPFVEELRARGGRIELANGGRLALTADGIVVIIDPRFEGDHAGRGSYQLAVYARDENKAQHELAELRALLVSARQLGILTEADADETLGEKLQAWANDVTVTDDVRLARQNQLIGVAHNAHHAGLIAEGRTAEAARLSEPEPLTLPVDGFDITIAADGTRALTLYRYLRGLNEEGLTPLTFSAAQLVAATVLKRPGLLSKPELMTTDVIARTFTRLGKFDAAVADGIILGAPDLSFERVNLFKKLADILQMVTAQREDDTLAEAMDQLRYQYPQEFEDILSPLPKVELNRRLSLLSSVQRRYHRGELPEVISFGDKHGRTEDLYRILDRARHAARTGERLVIVGHGDGFDRGTDNRAVFDIFKELKALAALHDNIDVKLLFGNHDVWLMMARLVKTRRDEDVWFRNGGTTTAEEFARRPGAMEELMHFMIHNFDLYTVDAWSMLHIHGGFNVSMQGEPRFDADKLQALQARLEDFRRTSTWTGEGEIPAAEKDALWQLMRDMENVLTISRETWDLRFRDIKVNIDPEDKELMFEAVKSQILRIPGNDSPTDAELREFFDGHWQELLVSNPDMFFSMGIMFDFDDSGRDRIMVNRLDRFLTHMGVLGVVNGHHHHNELYNADQRIFGVDVDDDDAGHLVMGADGVRFYPVNRPGYDEIVSKEAIDPHWERQKQRVLAHFAERELIKQLGAGKLKPTDEDAAILVRAGEHTITMADQAGYAAAAKNLVQQIADRGLTTLLFTGNSAFITMELIKEEWVRRYGSEEGLPALIVMDNYVGTRGLPWAPEQVVQMLQRSVPGFLFSEFQTQLRAGHIGVLDEHILSATKMKTYRKLFIEAFGTAPVIGALTAARSHYKHIAAPGTKSFGEFDILVGTVDQTLAEKLGGYAREMRDEWRARPPYRTTGFTDQLVELIKDAITDPDQSMLADWDWDRSRMVDVDPAFDRFVAEGGIDPADLRLLKEILSADEKRLAALLEEGTGKVYIKEEDEKKLARNGRTVYLQLERPLSTPSGDIRILRIKGARPQWEQDGGELMPHMGSGMVREPVLPDGNGNIGERAIDFDFKTMRFARGSQNPLGAQRLRRAEQEFRMMQRGTSGAGFETDYPIAFGTWKQAAYEGEPAGFVIAGMREEDKRLTINLLVDPQKLISETHTGEFVVTDTGTALEIYRQIGASLRAYHDAGYFHRYPHQGNIGVEFPDDANVRVVLRDLDTTVNRSELTMPQSRRVETAYRFLDLQRVVSDLIAEGFASWQGTHAQTDERMKPFVKSLMRGYFGTDELAEDDFNAVLAQSASHEFGGLVRALRGSGEKLMLNRQTSRFGKLWQALHAVSDSAVLAGESHYDYGTGERDRLADAALNLVEKAAGQGITRVFFTGTSAFISRELFSAAWETRFGETIALPELMVLPDKKLYVLWRAGDLPKELKRLYPRLDQQQLTADLKAGRVALIDDHAGSGAKLKSFHRLFINDLGTAPVFGALISQHERLEHIGFNSSFGGFDVMYGAIEYDLVDKLNAYTRSHREQWLDRPPYTERDGRPNGVTDSLVEAIKTRLQPQDAAVLSENPGGIDLNPQGLKMTISGDAAPLFTPAAGPIPIPDVDGYVPVILHIAPTTHLTQLLGAAALSSETHP